MQDSDVEKMITDGFVDSETPSTVHFARAERGADGAYQFKIGHRDPDFCEFSSGMPGLGFTEALDLMDKWERDTRENHPKRMKSGEFGVQGPNFRAVAKEMGIPVGPEEKSLHHAARAKRAALSHQNRRRKGPQP